MTKTLVEILMCLCILFLPYVLYFGVHHIYVYLRSKRMLADAVEYGVWERYQTEPKKYSVTKWKYNEYVLSCKGEDRLFLSTEHLWHDLKDGAWIIAYPKEAAHTANLLTMNLNFVQK